jgi:hypothetical protein
MLNVLAAFGTGSDERALFLVVGVIAFVIAALVSVTETKAEARGGAFVGWQFLIALGLALWLFPFMWVEAATAW